MKKYLIVALLAFSASAFAGLTNMSIQKMMSEMSYDMSNFVAGTTFSKEDNDEPTDDDNFFLSEQLFKRNIALSFSGYAESFNGNFNAAGSAERQYAIVSNPKNLREDFSDILDEYNRLVFHVPEKGKDFFSITFSGYKAGTSVTFKGCVEEVSGKASGIVKFEVLYNGKKIGNEISVSSGGFENIDIPVLAEELGGKSSATFVLRRVSDTGDDLVVAFSTFAIIGEPELLSAMGDNLNAGYGTITTLTASFKEPITVSDLVWQESVDGKTFTTIPGSDGKQTIDVNPPTGRAYYRVEAKGYKSGIIMTVREITCGGNTKVLWEENFGILPSKGSRSDVKHGADDGKISPDYRYADNGNVEDGKYAVVANPRTAGEDNGTAANRFWFRDIYDNTQGAPIDGKFGGMLLINCGDGTKKNDVVMERKVRLGCKNVDVDFSVYFANADWNRNIEGASTNDIVMIICVLSPEKDTLAQVKVEASIEESWKKGSASFHNDKYDTDELTLQIINRGLTGGGNDVLIDDIKFVTCKPNVSLIANVNGEDITDISELQVDINDDVVYKADIEDKYVENYHIDCPYYKWMVSDDKNNWEPIEGQEGVTCRKPTPQTGSNECKINEVPSKKYYKCIIGENKEGVDAYIADPIGNSCSNVVETQVSLLRSPKTGDVTCKQIDCNTYRCTFDNQSTTKVNWYYGFDRDCSDVKCWTLIEGKEDKDVDIEITKGMIPPSNHQLYIKAEDASNSNIYAISQSPVIYKELSLTANLNETLTEGCDMIFNVVADYKENGFSTPASVYTFTNDQGMAPVGQSSNTYITKLPAVSANYSVTVGKCSASAFADATCPQISSDHQCRDYTFTMKGWQGGDIVWKYKTSEDTDWKVIDGEKTTTLHIADIMDLFPEGSTVFKVRVEEGTAFDEIDVNVYELSLDVEQKGSDICDKTYVITAKLLNNYADDTSKSFMFYKYQEDGTWLDLESPDAPKYETEVLSRTTKYMVKSEGCIVDTLLNAGCPQLSYTYTCNEYSFSAYNYEGTTLEWYYWKPAINDWELIEGVTGNTYSVDISTLYKESDAIKKIKVVQYDGKSSEVNVELHSISIKTDKESVAEGLESAVITLTASPNVGWLSIKGATLYDNKSGEYEKKFSDNEITWTVSPVTKTEYYAKSGDGCTSNLIDIDIKAKPSINIEILSVEGCNSYRVKANVSGMSVASLSWYENVGGSVLSSEVEFVYTLTDDKSIVWAECGGIKSNVLNFTRHQIGLQITPGLVFNGGASEISVVDESFENGWLPTVVTYLYSSDLSGVAKELVGSVQSDNPKWSVNNEEKAYYIARTSDGCVSNVGTVDVVWWPTIFMPFADGGTNNLFAPFTKVGDTRMYLDAENIEFIKIFDRTGNMVAEVKGEYWNGTSADGKVVMPNVYFYAAKLVGNDNVYKGTIEVFKDKVK